MAHPHLNPVMMVEDVPYVLATPAMIARKPRARSVVANLDDHYDQIRSALDMIFLGF